MKSFITFRCGHRFHKHCIQEHIQIAQQKKGIQPEQAAEVKNENLLEDEIETYLVAPSYKPLPIYDKNRKRRHTHLKNKIEDNTIARHVLEKNYNKCIKCSAFEIL
jgi:hypothetical protein